MDDEFTETMFRNRPLGYQQHTPQKARRKVFTTSDISE